MYPFLLRAIAAALLLNGCATASLWGGYGDTRYTTQTQQETDSLLAFARPQANSRHLPPDSLVMLGERYIYVVEHSHAFGEWSNGTAENNSALLAVLTAKLSQAFELHSESANGIKIGATRLNGIPVGISSISPQHFDSAFCLQYPENTQLSAAERQRETLVLEKLHFIPIAANGGTQAYRRCFRTRGRLYAKPADMRYDYRFATPVPIHLSIMTYHTHTQNGTLWRTLLTPFAAVADIVVLPLSLPIATGAAKNMRIGW